MTTPDEVENKAEELDEYLCKTHKEWKVDCVKLARFHLKEVIKARIEEHKHFCDDCLVYGRCERTDDLHRQLEELGEK